MQRAGSAVLRVLKRLPKSGEAPATQPWALQVQRQKRSKTIDRIHVLQQMAEGGPASIVKAGELVLRQEAQDVPPDKLGSQELRSLVDVMLETMRAAPGVGLAAPQIGVGFKVIVLEDKEEYIGLVPAGVAEQQARQPFEALVVVNPRLRALGSEGARHYEGCLSIPGYQALVERYNSVEVEGLTIDGEPLRLQAHGWQARIFQHECDHLQGVLYVDRMLSRSFSARGGAKDLPLDVQRPGACTCCHSIDQV